MSSMTDKAKGLANEAVGAAKQKAGEVLDKPDLEAKGAAQKIAGKAQQAVGDAKDKVKNLVDKA